MNGVDHMVFVVDDDERVREALAELLESLGFRATTFASANEYASFQRPEVPSCLVLDVELPDINGLEFQARHLDAQAPPIVFITGYGDVPSSVRAIKGGAVDFLTKPLSETDLVAAIRTAIDKDREQRAARAELGHLQHRLSSLTPRERQVLPLVVSGLLNKQAAAELGISEVTLQIHRSKIMQKMKAATFADLVRMSMALGIPKSPERSS